MAVSEFKRGHSFEHQVLANEVATRGTFRFCRFLLEESADGQARVPRLSYDPREPNAPCNSLTGEEVLYKLVGEFVPSANCLRARELGLCPRNLGPVVPENLIPTNGRRI